jgi:hypothetical protein
MSAFRELIAGTRTVRFTRDFLHAIRRRFTTRQK